MDLGFLLRGLAIGFSIAVPVGPIGVLCIRRTLAHGRLVGLLSGLGAATADAVYGCVAGFGLTSVSTFLVSHQTLLRAAGGAFLIYLGVRILLAPPTKDKGDSGTLGRSPWAEGGDGGLHSRPGRSSPALISAYASVFVLTLANPMTIMSFAAIFTGLGIGAKAGSYVSAALLVVGVFIGSAVWWVIVSLGAGASRDRLGTPALRWANRLAGVVLFAFGVAAIAASVS